MDVNLVACTEVVADSGINDLCYTLATGSEWKQMQEWCKDGSCNTERWRNSLQTLPSKVHLFLWSSYLLQDQNLSRVILPLGTCFFTKSLS